MRYSTLNELPTTRDMVDVFGGYNHNLRINDGEFYDMTNMTSDHYPVLAPRQQRGVYKSGINPQGLIAKDALCYVDGSNFVIDEYIVDMGLSTAVEDCPKQLISMGAYVIILPDKKWINTADITEFGNIEASVTTEGTVNFSLCSLDGADYEIKNTQDTEPESPENMDYWIDTSTQPHTLKQWSSVSSMWVTVPTTYIKISATGIGVPFKQYDGVKISGLTGSEYSDIAAIDGAFVVWTKGDDYLVIVGMLDTTRSLTDAVTVARTMPDMDFVTESENRLWGCRYGIAEDGNVVNEIYASKLGDFKNWNCFMGLSTDSYVVSVGTDGQFTGAVTHLGYPLFFKENCMHKIYGNYPANYQLQTTACRGVQKGCSASLAIVNEVLYYKSRQGVCAYDGSLPTEISTQLGNEVYDAAVGCAHHDKYYISMRGADGEYDLFVYDASKGLWHREDATQVKLFCSCDDELYYVDGAGGSIKTMLGSGTKDTDKVTWMAETGALGTDSPDRKYISRLTVRMSMEIGATVSFKIQYDSVGDWETQCVLTGNSLRSFAIPLRPRRCDHFKLRIEGTGDARIYSIAKIIEEGSDRW